MHTFYLETLQNRALLRVALGIVFFWSIAGLAQINIDAFAEESGSISESQRTPLLISLILGVGVGSVFAGLASGHRIAMGLVPWGAAGIAICCGLLFFAPEGFIDDRPLTFNKVVACLMLAGLGVSAGFYDVPLAAYLQHRSPLESRGGNPFREQLPVVFRNLVDVVVVLGIPHARPSRQLG